MDNSTLTSEIVRIRALLAGIDVEGNLRGKRRHFVIVSVDGKEIARSKKKSEPVPQWQWEKNLEFLFDPSSTIKIEIYRESQAKLDSFKHLVGWHTGKVTDLLNNDATIGLEDENGAEIASRFKIRLSPIADSEDAFSAFMKTVEDDTSRLENSGLPESTATSVLRTLSIVLHWTKSIVDVIPDAHPILIASRTVISAVYKAVKRANKLDDAVRDLAESFRGMLDKAKEKGIEDTTDVIKEIGRTSLKVASLIYEYAMLFFLSRAVSSQFSDDLKTRTEQYQKDCDNLKKKYQKKVIIGVYHKLETIHDDELAAKIYTWLSAPDSSENYNDARKKHQQNTGSWFLDGERFRQFQERPADFLWIKGKAGSGKTILCSSIIDKVMKDHEENPSLTYAYFFFDGRDSRRDLQLHDKFIRSLIEQLSRQCDGIPDVLAKLHRSMNGEQLSTHSLEEILYNIIKGMPSTYVIIDSLDECIEQKKTLEWIKGIVRKISTLRLHVVVASRPERGIQDVLQPLGAPCIDLAMESTNHDIEKYLEKELLLLEKVWDKKTQDIVKSTLITNADGMFRWVTLQLSVLKTCSTPLIVKKQLMALPKGLNETYDRILLKIDGEDHTDIKTFLRWLCFAVRPMSLSEISETISVHFDPENCAHFSEDHRYWNNQTVLGLCPSLIIESKGMIKLAHFSVKEYLLSEHLLQFGAASIFHFTSEEHSHSLIAQTCLAYLLHFDKPDLVDEDMAISFPLAPYAAEYWIFHAQSGDIEKPKPSESNTLTLAKKLFTPKEDAWFTNWVQIWDLDDPYKSMQYYKRVNIGPPLYYASLAGLEQLSLQLMEDGNVNMQGGNYGNPLQAASAGGHKGVVELLLNKGADPNAQGGYYGNALQAASARGHEGIVKLLLDKGADPNAQGGRHGNVLQAASAEGHEGIVELLLDKGADLNAQGGVYGNALQAASAEGHEGIVELLLEKGADPNAQGGYCGNAIQAASGGGREEIVKLLLENGADPNAQGGYFGNALQAASAGGYERIVKLLLKNSADPNAQGGRHGNALQAALAGGYEEIVMLLLENGAHPNVQGDEYGNILWAASAGGREEIVKLLLDNGADPKIQGGEYGNALQAALTGGHEGIVKLLLDNGADQKMQGGNYGNALLAASAGGDERITKLLLDNDADPNMQGGEYGNALQAASAEGHEELVKLLLENGADPNMQGGVYGNALQAASTGGHEGIVNLLLENDADPKVRGGEYGNALWAASAGGHEGIVKLLLEKGADPKVQGDEYDSALYTASSGGHKGTVKLLLDNDVDPNMLGGFYSNALQAAAAGGYEGLVKLLLDNGADPNIQGGFYSNALQAASARGHKRVVKVLLENGADPDLQGGRHGNALQAATAEGHEETVKLLVQHGAEIHTSS